MRKFVGMPLVLGLLVMAVGTASSQDGRGLRQELISGFMLLGQESVQKDLKLSDDQIKDVEAAQAKMNKNWLELRDLDQEDRTKKLSSASVEGERTITEILKPEQIERFQEINRQQEGLYQTVEAKDGVVAAALKLTDDQKEKIQTIGEGLVTEMRESFKAADGGQNKLTAKMQALRQSGDEKVMSLLTEGQRSKWKELIGQPFYGELTFR